MSAAASPVGEASNSHDPAANSWRSGAPIGSAPLLRSVTTELVHRPGGPVSRHGQVQGCTGVVDESSPYARELQDRSDPRSAELVGTAYTRAEQDGRAPVGAGGQDDQSCLDPLARCGEAHRHGPSRADLDAVHQHVWSDL